MNAFIVQAIYIAAAVGKVLPGRERNRMPTEGADSCSIAVTYYMVLGVEIHGALGHGTGKSFYNATSETWRAGGQA